MRRRVLLALSVLLLPAPLAAQRPAARWALHLNLARESFGGASSDTSTIPGTTVEVYPAPRLATELGVSRRFGEWELALGASYASGDLRARTDRLVLDDRTTSLKRYRGSLLVGRQLLALREVSLRLMLGPVIDHWTATGLGDQTALGGRVGLALRIPLGRVELEHRALFGLSPSPFNRRDLPPEARIESLRSWSLGVGLRVSL